MKNSENLKFEKVWQEAFANAEAEANSSMWAHIDSQLTRAESGLLKRNIVFYQRLAAASILFALLLGGTVLFWKDSTEGNIASSKTEKTNTPSGNNPQDLKGSPADSVSIEKNQKPESAVVENSTRANTQEIASLPATRLKQKQSKPVDQKLNSEENSLVAVDESKTSPTQDTYRMSTPSQHSRPEFYDGLPSLMKTIPETEIKLSGEPATEIASAWRLYAVQKAAVAKRKTERENWWAGIGGSAGSYNPQTNLSQSGFGSPTGSLRASPGNQNPSSASQPASLGSSYSFGMNVGKRVAPRWIVLTGVNYLTQSINYTSNVAAFGSSNLAKASVAELDQAAGNTLIITSPYELNSVNEFVSVPVQAGYLLVNRKIGWQINAGVASDFFVRNSLVDRSGNLDKSTQSAGENSSYKTVNWTGLMGTEVSYKVSKHYSFSLVPGMRYSFQSIVKPAVGTSISPFVWDVGFRFRYIF